jgi:hypothetical protein
MAYTTLTVNQLSRSGLTLAPAAANADGSYVKNDGHVLLYIVNGDSSDKTVTVTPTRRQGGAAVVADTRVIAAGGDVWMGPYPTEIFNDALGNLLVTFSAVTSVTIAAVRTA